MLFVPKCLFFWPLVLQILIMIGEGAQEKVTDIRLPTHLKPLNYTIHLTPFIVPGNFTIDGFVEILLSVESPAKNVTLHAKKLSIDEQSVQVLLENDAAVTVTEQECDSDREFLILHLEESLDKNQLITVKMNFLAELNDDLSGFYRSSYIHKGDKTIHYIAVTQFQSTDARKAFPCLDEPAMKATFQVNLGRKKTMTAVSNMPIKEKGLPMEGTEEYVWDTFESTAKMSTYLLAFFISDFEYLPSSQNLDHIPFRIWSRQSSLNQTQYAVDIGPRILKYYEELYDLPYPLPKQDMVAVPDAAFNGMENWGLIIYRETGLLYKEGVTSASDKQFLVRIVAHELAHQWFGNLVTMEWWSDLWLNEGFATFMQYWGAIHVFPESQMMDQFNNEQMHLAFETDALETSHPVSVEVGHPDDINQIFDKISYQKGGSILRMMANFLGTQVFFKGVSNYLKKFTYDNTVQDELWASITTRAKSVAALEEDMSIKAIMDTWTLQMGYPVVTVNREGSAISFSQTRFLLVNNEENEDDSCQMQDCSSNYTWWVPVTYTFMDDPDFSVGNKRTELLWLSPTNTKQSISTDNHAAILVNVQQTGYYRVNYDRENWNNLSQLLQKNHKQIHRVNRAQILDDALNLARAGLLDYPVALSTTKYLEQEEDYIPWEAALRSFDFLQSMVYKTAGYGLLKNHLIRILLPVLNRLGMGLDNNGEGTFLESHLRAMAFGQLCGLGDTDCVATAQESFNTWMNQSDPDSEGANAIGADFRPAVYCTAVSQGTIKEWNFLFQRYLKADNANEQNVILSALGCSGEAWLLTRYLDRSMIPSSGLRRQDGNTIIQSVASSSPLGNFIAWHWIQTEWDQIRDYFDTAIASPLTKFIPSVTQGFNTDLELDQLQSFYNKHLSNLGTAKSSIEDAIQTTKANIQWMNKQYTPITEWLGRQQLRE